MTGSAGTRRHSFLVARGVVALALLQAAACSSTGTEPTPGDTAPKADSATSAEHTGGAHTPATTTLDALSFGSGRVPTNLLVVSLDTTRRDRLGRYSDLDTTPFLDQLMETSVVLDDHRSCSNWTAPSMLCATTGRLPLEDQYWPASGDPSVPGVPENLDTLARLLGDAGYATRLVTANAVFSPKLAGHGFEEVTVLDGEGAPEVRAAAVAAAEAFVDGGKPWHLHLHFFDPHQSYCPPSSYRTGEGALPSIAPHDLCDDLSSALDALWTQGSDTEREAFLQHLELLYAGELRAWDDTFAETWSDLEALGALDDTLVVFYTDHGEQFLERGVLDHSFHLYAEENRAAAAFWARDLSSNAWTAPTLHQDLAATLFALYGLDPERAATGFPLGLAPADRVRYLMNYIASESGLVVGAVRGDAQLTYHWSGEYKTLHRDAPQRDDVYNAEDPEVIALWEELDVLVQQIQAAWPELPDPVDVGP